MEPRKLDWSNFRTDDNWWREEGRKVARPEDHPWIDELNPLSASGLDTAAREYSHGFWDSSSKALGRDIREEFELWVSIYKVAKNSTDDAGHDLPVFWLIHRSLRTYDGKVPALVKIHGGGHVSKLMAHSWLANTTCFSFLSVLTHGVDYRSRSPIRSSWRLRP